MTLKQIMQRLPYTLQSTDGSWLIKFPSMNDKRFEKWEQSFMWDGSGLEPTSYLFHLKTKFKPIKFIHLMNAIAELFYESLSSDELTSKEFRHEMFKCIAECTHLFNVSRYSQYSIALFLFCFYYRMMNGVDDSKGWLNAVFKNLENNMQEGTPEQRSYNFKLTKQVRQILQKPMVKR